MTTYYSNIADTGARNGSGLTATDLDSGRQVTHLPAHTPQRIVLVSNRLPFTVAEKDGDIEFQNSAGGVATGLHALLETIEIPNIGNAEYVWIGWPGGRVSPLPAFGKNAVHTAAYSHFCQLLPSSGSPDATLLH